MNVRKISDPTGSYVTQNEIAKPNTQGSQASQGVSTSAEAIQLADDFGRADPAEEDRRAKRVQELKAQHDAGTLKPADSSAIAKKIIEELNL